MLITTALNKSIGFNELNNQHHIAPTGSAFNNDVGIEPTYSRFKMPVS